MKHKYESDRLLIISIVVIIADVLLGYVVAILLNPAILSLFLNHTK